MKFLKVLFLCFCLCCYGKEKILIISHHCAQPYFIEVQAKTFQKFLKDDYTFVIFNDGKTPKIRNEIDQLCKKYNIICDPIDLNLLSSINNPSERHAKLINYSLNKMGYNFPGLVVLIDSDMFLIKSFSFIEFMQNFDLAAVLQSRGPITYLWPGLTLMNMQTLPDKTSLNFNCGTIDGNAVDTGGFTYYYFSKYFNQFLFNAISIEDSSLTMKKYHERTLEANMQHIIPFLELADLPNFKINVDFLLHGTFIHYRSGSLWEAKTKGYYEKKNKILQTFINQILK